MATNIVQMTDGTGNKQYPVTSAEAVGMPDGSGNLTNYLDKRVTEYNVSVLHPTSGSGGSNKYTLETAIAQVPSKYRSVGIKCAFINEDGESECWEYKVGSWNVNGFVQVGSAKLTELDNNIFNATTKILSIYDIPVKQWDSCWIGSDGNKSVYIANAAVFFYEVSPGDEINLYLSVITGGVENNYYHYAFYDNVDPGSESLMSESSHLRDSSVFKGTVTAPEGAVIIGISVFTNQENNIGIIKSFNPDIKKLEEKSKYNDRVLSVLSLNADIRKGYYITDCSQFGSSDYFDIYLFDIERFAGCECILRLGHIQGSGSIKVRNFAIYINSEIFDYNTKIEGYGESSTSEKNKEDRIITIPGNAKTIAITVDAGGNDKVSIIPAENIYKYLDELENANKGKLSDTEDKGFFVTDSDGNVVLSIDEKGFADFTQAKREELDVEPADIYHIITYGQSLSCGYDSFPIQSTKQKYDSLMLNTGVIYDRIKDLSSVTSFSPLIEQQNEVEGIGTQGETPCSGISEGLIESFIKHSGTDKKGFQLLLSACGIGGADINQLAQSDNLQRVYNVIDKGYFIAQNMGKTYKVLAVLWMQGEANGGDVDTDMNYYTEKLKQIYSSINNYAKSKTSQVEDVYNFTYLPCCGPNPALAIYELCKDDNNKINCCGAIYRMPQNFIHLLGYSSYSYGYKCGNTMFDKIFLKSKTNNVYPIKHWIKGNVIYITFKADEYPLVLENYILRWQDTSESDQISTSDGGNNVDFEVDKRNFGFSIKNNSGREIITKVEVTRYDMIKITCNESPVGNKLLYAAKEYKLHYSEGVIGSRVYGGLRDSRKKVFVNTSNGKDTLYNVCVPFVVEL